jgi:hypothetical protein
MEVSWEVFIWKKEKITRYDIMIDLPDRVEDREN